MILGHAGPHYRTVSGLDPIRDGVPNRGLLERMQRAALSNPLTWALRLYSNLPADTQNGKQFGDGLYLIPARSG